MLKIANIYHSFPSHFEPILNDISLEIPKGEFCVLLGSNGSGKSTFLKTISGEYPLQQGTVSLTEQNIGKLPFYKRAHFIGSVIQDITQGTIPEMSLFENMTLGMLRGRNPKFSDIKHHREKILAKIESLGLGLEKYIDEPLAILSGGQRQVIATIMAFMTQPELLLLDEHCSALDPKTSHQLMEYTTKMIVENKVTTIMITHNLSDALKYGDRLLILQRGKIALDVKGAEKERLTIDHILSFYHKAEAPC